MDKKPQSTPLSAPPKIAPQPVVKPPVQLHDPDSPENLLSRVPASSLLDGAARVEPTPMTWATPQAGMPLPLPAQTQQAPPPRRPEPTAEEAEELLILRDRLGGMALLPSAKNTTIYEPPAIKITEAEVRRLEDSVINNTSFSYRFERGKFSAVFRVKTANELDFQRACLGKMSVDGKFGLNSDYIDAICKFNLALQLAEYNGQPMSAIHVPPRPWRPEDLNLEEQFWSSPYATISEVAQFVLQGTLAQFEGLVFECEKRMLDPANFPPVGAASS